jgi:FecR protein
MALNRVGKMFALWVVLAAALLSVSASAESKARIVRLSAVQGTVQIDRGTGDGFDRAFENLPVIEGVKVKTGKDGRTEVEFEDGSALRLAPGSEVNFTRLALGEDGQKLDTVQLVSGTVYANLYMKDARGKDNAGDQFLLNFAHESVTPTGAAHFRVALVGTSKATVAVFKGKLSATGPSGQFDVAEKHSATINFAKDDVEKTDASTLDHADKERANNDSSQKDSFVIARNYDDDPSDSWDHQQSDYHDRYASTSSSTALSSPYSYGMSDLNYYGNFMMLPGYGTVWQPYLAGANWNPFMDGGWSFYPGAGYMFVSGYPWGWMPYLYGSWLVAPGYGWVWEPGNWNSYSVFPRVANAPAGMILPTAPTSGHQTVMVGRGLAADPADGAPGRLTISPNSAGFGVPRGSVKHLDQVAKNVNRTARPVVVSTVRPAPSTVGSSSSALGFGPDRDSMTSPAMTRAPRGSAAQSARPK